MTRNASPASLGRLPAIALVIVALIGITNAGPAEAADKRKAIFIIVDGIPADVIESVSTPNIDAITNEGGYTRAFVGGEIGTESESPTVSAVGYMSLITGTWANKHNVYDNEVEDPDYAYWDIFRMAKAHDPSLRTAIFSTWTDNRTKLLGDGLADAGGTKLDIVVDGFELDTERYPHDEQSDYIRAIDEQVVSATVQAIGESGPDLSWVYLQYTDDIAHFFGDSPQWSGAVQLADDQVGRIWNAVRARRENHDEDWLIVVTTDHGREAETGKGHGGQSDRERTTWIATNSGRLSERFHDHPGIVDILPSIAAHLELDIPAEVREALDGQSFIR